MGDGIEKVPRRFDEDRRCAPGILRNTRSSAFDPNNACASRNLSPLTDPPNLPGG